MSLVAVDEGIEGADDVVAIDAEVEAKWFRVPAGTQT